ncbi:MAG: hypothetical protein IJK71_11875 [Clostridia bacterium]|nr:hypothetical protein [Clostridia bacterium]
MKKLTVAGCIFWIVGLIVFIVGMNINSSIRETMMTLGSVVFLMGLAINGVVWAKRKNDENK